MRFSSVVLRKDTVLDMNFPEEQLAELKKAFPGVSYAEEGGNGFLLLPQLKLPSGCSPSTIKALLCPTVRDGYHSRLFFASVPTCNVARTWNRSTILGEDWYACSWQTSTGLTLLQMIGEHLDAVR